MIDLEESRKRIDEIDSQLTDLFCERMKVVEEVTAYKRAHQMEVLQPAREKIVLEKAAERAGAQYADQVKVLFTSIMEISKSAQHAALDQKETFLQRISQARTLEKFPAGEKVNVACQGVPGAYSQKACQTIFQNPNISFFPAFEDVFSAVESGSCQYGILPIENSSAGSVTAVYDLMRKHHFYIQRGLKLKIEHTLLVSPGTALSDITDVYSHEQGILQCQQFFKQNPQIHSHIDSNTAAAAKFVAENPGKGYAAIASDTCASLYGLVPLIKGIQDCQSNFTRFICISKELRITPDADKISLSLTLPHVTGSLYRLISRFAMNGLSLTKLESRPLPETNFEFMFYFDFEGSASEHNVAELLACLQAELSYFSFLGNYKELVSN